MVLNSDWSDIYQSMKNKLTAPSYIHSIIKCLILQALDYLHTSISSIFYYTPACQEGKLSIEIIKDSTL